MRAVRRRAAALLRLVQRHERQQPEVHVAAQHHLPEQQRERARAVRLRRAAPPRAGRGPCASRAQRRQGPRRRSTAPSRPGTATQRRCRARRTAHAATPARAGPHGDAGVAAHGEDRHARRRLVARDVARRARAGGVVRRHPDAGQQHAGEHRPEGRRERRSAPRRARRRAMPTGRSQSPPPRSEMAPNSGCTRLEETVRASTSAPTCRYERPSSSLRYGSSAGTAPCAKSTDAMAYASAAAMRRASVAGAPRSALWSPPHRYRPAPWSGPRERREVGCTCR